MLDRDFNAAWIVLKRGLAQVGQDMPELKPVETGPLSSRTTGTTSPVGEAGTIRGENHATQQEPAAGSPRLQSWEDVTVLGIHLRGGVPLAVTVSPLGEKFRSVPTAGFFLDCRYPEKCVQGTDETEKIPKTRHFVNGSHGNHQSSLRLWSCSSKP
jgi:hypothetical protein